jgi:glycolate oxidase
MGMAREELGYSYRRLVNILGPDRVAAGSFERSLYSHDFATLPKPAYFQFNLDPDFVVLPKSTEEVIRVVRFSEESGLPLVPAGGRSGLYGGAVPNRGGILVDMRMMNRVTKVDPESRTVKVQAGATWHEVARHAAHHGLYLPYGPHFARSSTVGGWISRGGVGVGSPKYGTVRENLLNLDVVLHDGSLLQTGHDRIDLGPSFANLKSVFLGGEGTLGIVTRAVLRLYPKPEEVRPLAYAFPATADTAPALEALARSEATPTYVGLFDKNHLSFLKAMDPDGMDPVAVVSVLLDGAKDEVAEEERIVDAVVAAKGGTKLGSDAAAEWWRRREYQFPTRRISRGLVVAEGSVPLANFAKALDAVRALARWLKMEVALHAFLADGNTVVLLPYFLTEETSPRSTFALSFVKSFGDVCLEYGGRPFGLGLLMVFNLERMHGSAAVHYPAVKEAMDPRNAFNPGKTVEVWTRLDLPLLEPVKIPPKAMAFLLDVLGSVKRYLVPRDDYVRRKLRRAR